MHGSSSLPDLLPERAESNPHHITLQQLQTANIASYLDAQFTDIDSTSHHTLHSGVEIFVLSSPNAIL